MPAIKQNVHNPMDQYGFGTPTESLRRSASGNRVYMRGAAIGELDSLRVPSAPESQKYDYFYWDNFL
jgi:hypothetical protein